MLLFIGFCAAAGIAWRFWKLYVATGINRARRWAIATIAGGICMLVGSYIGLAGGPMGAIAGTVPARFASWEKRSGANPKRQ